MNNQNIKVKSKKISSLRIYHLSVSVILVMTLLLFNLTVNAQTNTKVDKNSITQKATKIKDYQGGSLYRIGVMDIVVLNGTYKEMGQQYGYLVKDKIIGARDAWKKIFVESEKIAYEDILKVIGMPVYTSVPKAVKDMYEGIAETSGLKLTEVVIMDNWIPLVLLGRRAGCSSYIAWGSKSTDGTAYMARNLDFPDFSRKLVTNFGVVTVLNPAGSEYGLAGVGIAGTVTGFNDMMNSAGLYCEFKNGLGSIEPVWYSNRLDILAFMAANLRNYSSIDELRIQFNTTKSNYPAIIGV